MHRKQTDVLIVGAGPVGMLAALLLRQSGVRVRIIDQEECTTTHSYACALHPGTLKLLAEEEVYYDLLSNGQHIDSIAIFDNAKLRAKLELSQMDNEFRSVLILSQNEFEDAIERKLADNGVEIEWVHRLSEIHREGEKVIAQVDRLRESGKGYAVPSFDWEVVKRLEIEADFVIGADGHNSHLRRSLGINLTPIGSRRTFALFEFETDNPLDIEMRIVLHDGVNVLWPLPDNCGRWTFELTSEELEDFPIKERSPFLIEDAAGDRERRALLQELLSQRAPWFQNRIKELKWAPRVQFGPSLAERFGEHRCWLIGDAAHQTGPIGVQSLNVGLREAADLARRIIKIFQDKTSFHLLQEFEQERRQEWQKLLGVETVKAQPQADSWIRQNAQQILSCIPASGHELSQLLGQLQIDFHPHGEFHAV